ncbi:MAG: 5-formyltetrahydrofolate cyclo-ligase [Spirochaetes bacterium]|nr:5-formyltetrahydrofolate cyclo-ligase [Spirochaetota bacterium]
MDRPGSDGVAAHGAGVAEAKAAMRKRAKAALAGVAPGDRAAAASAAAASAAATAAYGEARLVLAFLSMPSEIDTRPAIESALASGKRVAVPRISGDEIAFVELVPGWRDWPRDRWDIPEPPATAPGLSPEAIASTPTLALVPGLAFDRLGGRLGRGKGYYDRFLSRLAAARAGLGPTASPFAAIGYGYESQLVDAVPTDARDRPLDGLALG